MKDIQILNDKQDIYELRVKYAKAIDNQDWELFQKLFDRKVTVDFSKWGIPVSEMTVNEFTDMMKSTFSKEGLQTQHFMNNSLIEVNGDSASGETYVLAKHIVQTDGIEYFLDVNGYYVEKYIRTSSGWRIQSIQLNPRWSTGDPSEIFNF